MAGDGREGGFIKLHRRVKSWPLWKAMSCAQRAVWIELLFSANWKDEEAWYGSRRYVVRRGQLAHSEAEIAKRAKVGRQVVRDTFVRLTAEGAVTREPAMAGTQVPWLTTIINYEKFQGSDEDENPQANQSRTSEEPARNQPGTPREEEEEEEEGKTAPGSASAPPPKPDPKPPPPTAELPLLGASAAPPAPRPAAERASTARAAGASKPKAADPLRRELSDALVAIGREERGGSFAFEGAKDAQGVSRLLGYTRDVAEHVRRFRLALRSPAVEYGFRVDSIAAFATSRVWNHFAPPKVGRPTHLAPLGRPGA